jgi:hypothetical protein
MTQSRPGRVYQSRGYGREDLHYPPQPPEDAQWPPVSGEPPRRRWRPPLAVLIVLLVLALAGGTVAAFVYIGPASARGSRTPGEAVDGFLGAIFTNHDARAAARFVCARARNDDELDQTVFNVRNTDSEYAGALVTWAYATIRPTGDSAQVPVTLTLKTANDQVADRQITVALVDDRGWWVCDINTDDAAGH